MASYGSGRLVELVKRLNLATSKGDLEWQETDDTTAFMCIFDGPSVQIKSTDRDGSYPYILLILNEEGNVVESLRSGSDPWDDSEMGELYERARRSATNVDDIIDSILKDLPKIPPPQKPEPEPEPEPEPSGYSDEPPF